MATALLAYWQRANAGCGHRRGEPRAAPAGAGVAQRDPSPCACRPPQNYQPPGMPRMGPVDRALGGGRPLPMTGGALHLRQLSWSSSPTSRPMPPPATSPSRPAACRSAITAPTFSRRRPSAKTLLCHAILARHPPTAIPRRGCSTSRPKAFVNRFPIQAAAQNQRIRPVPRKLFRTVRRADVDDVQFHPGGKEPEPGRFFSLHLPMSLGRSEQADRALLREIRPAEPARTIEERHAPRAPAAGWVPPTLIPSTYELALQHPARPGGESARCRCGRRGGGSSAPTRSAPNIREPRGGAQPRWSPTAADRREITVRRWRRTCCTNLCRQADRRLTATEIHNGGPRTTTSSSPR